MELSGEYIFKTLNCASNQSDSQQETLSHFLAATKQMGPEGIQALIDFLLSPAPAGLTREESYPFLTVLNVLLERGTRANDGSISLVDERLGTLQTFLLELNINRSLNLVNQWQASGQLEAMLKTFGLFLNEIESGHVGTLSHELLVGETLKPHLLDLSLELFAKRSLMVNIEDLMTPVPSLALLSSEQKNLGTQCLEAWVDTVPNSESTSCIAVSENITSSKAPQTGAERFDSFVKSIGDDQVEKLVDGLFLAFREYQSMASEERSLVNENIAKLVDDSISIQDNPAQLLLSLLYNLDNSSAADLELLTNAVEQLLEPKFDIPLNKLRSKMGISKLVDHSQELILNGGPIPGCDQVSLPGLKGLAKTASSSEFHKAFSKYLSPMEACSYMPPLAAAMAHELEVSLSFDCSSNSSEKRCIAVDPKHYGLMNSEFWQGDFESSPKLTQTLAVDTISEAIEQLKLDPYYLWNLNLSNGAIKDFTELNNLRQSLLGYPEGLSAEAIAVIDNEIATSNGTLSRDFLERLIALKVKDLASTAEQFTGLLPIEDSFDADNKAARVFAGLYSNGPMIQNNRKHFTLEQILSEISDDELRAELAAHPHRLSQFLFRLKRSDSIFKNPSEDRLGQASIQTFTLGSNVLNHVTIGTDGEFKLKNRNTISLKQLITDKPYLNQGLDENWALWSKHLYSGGLAVKDIPLAAGKKGPMGASAFEVWAASEALSQWQSEDYWQSILANNSASPKQAFKGDYFNSSDYGFGESRVMALYYMNHYHKAPMLVPEGASIEGSAKFSPSKPWLAFTNVGFLANPRNQLFPWKVYYNSFPKSLLRGGSTSLETLQGEIIPSFTELGDKELFGKRFTYGRKRAMKDFASSKFKSESLRWYSSLNLLTFTGTSSVAAAQPAVAVGSKYCYRNSDEKTPNVRCPIELSPDKPLEEAYADLEGFLADSLALKLCPLLQSSPDWQDRLGISLENIESCNFDQKKLFSLEAAAFPSWYGQVVLNDIFAMGKNPKLKPELATLPSQIKFAKMKLNAPKGTLTASTWLRQNSSPASQKTASADWHQQNSAMNLWVDNTDIISNYTALLRTLMGTEEFLEQSRAYALNYNGQQRPVLKQLLGTFVSTQREFAKKDATALEFALEMVKYIGQDEALSSAVANMINHHSSPVSHEFLANDLPAAVQGLFGLDFDWSDKGLLLSRFVINRDVLFGFRALVNDFKSQQLSGAIMSSSSALLKLGDVQQQSKTLSALIDLMLDLGLSKPQDKGLNVQFLNDTMKMWAQTRFTDSFALNFNRLLDGTTIKLKQLNGSSGESLLDILQSGTKSLIKWAPTLISTHAKSTSHGLDDQGFWSALALDGLKPLKQNKAGALALQNLISDERLGFTDGLWTETLLSEESCKLMSDGAAAVAKVDKGKWTAALSQTTDLLPRLSPVLELLDRKVVIEGKGKDEFKSSITTFSNLSRNSEGLLDRQQEVIDTWLTNSLNLYQ